MSKEHVDNTNPLNDDLSVSADIIYGNSTLTMRARRAGLKTDVDGQLVFGKHIVLTPAGLQITRQIDQEQWSQFEEVVCKLGKSIQLIIGDYLAYSEQWEYGVTYDKIAELTGYDEKTLRNMKWVCTNVDLSLRKDKVWLKFGHYNLVAGLEHDVQSEWLACAEFGKWTISQMREEMRRSREGDPPTLPSEEEQAIDEFLKVTVHLGKVLTRLRDNARYGDGALERIEGLRRILDQWEEMVRG